MSKTETLGVRLKNPGNMERSKDPWQGLADVQEHPRFFTFKTAAFGIRAAARTLITYQDRYNLHTVRAIISRWAPPNENNTDSYIDAVCQRTGFEADLPLDMQRYGDIEPLVTAIIAHENAGYKYPQAVIDEGLKLAGIVNTPKPPARTRTIKAVAASGVGTTGLAIEPLVREATQNIQPLVEFSPYIRLVFVGLIVFGLVVVAYQKVRAYRVETA